MPLGRRRYPRVDTTLPVRLEDSAGRRWQGESLNVGAGGLKVRSNATLEPGCRVWLNFTLPDGEPEISAASLMVRKDPNGLAFLFLGLERSGLDRIRRFVNDLLPRQPLKVLIVEDDASVSGVFAEFIRDQGHDALLAESAEAGLELIERFYPDAMLLDLSLPGMSGAGLLQLLADRRWRLPTVVISGVASEEEARGCLQLGALDFLPKPLPSKRFLTMLDFLEQQAIHWRLAEETSLPSST